MRIFLAALSVAITGCGGAFSANIVDPGDSGPVDGSSDAREAATGDAGTEAGGCVQGATQCNGTGVETCRNGAWVASACPYACQIEGGTASCGGSCVPGGAACDGQQPETCNDAGVWQSSGTECPEATSVCQAGSCKACTCASEADGGSASCFYAVSTPPSFGGTPSLVTVVFLTPASPKATFTPTITSPPAPDHNPVWYDLDVSAFASGGTITISGEMGSSGTDGSSFLLDQCATFPASGAFTPVENSANVAAGSGWSFAGYTFSAGTAVLHFGTEGSWATAAGGACPTACAPGQTNTNAVTVSVK